MNRKPIALLIAVLALVGLLSAACGGDGNSAGAAPAAGPNAGAAALQAGTNDQAQGISVSGQGTATAEPDIALLSLGVSLLADTAQEARDRAAEKMDALIASLQDNGIAQEDYHTTQFTISPETDYVRDRQVIRGYRVTSILSVKVRDLDRVGEVIDDAVDAVGDPVRVQGITFSIDDPAELQSEARTEAMAQAQAKAQELADLADVDLGPPLTISESSGGVQPPVFFRAAGELAPEAATPIEPGQAEVSVTVQVTYSIQ